MPQSWGGMPESQYRFAEFQLDCASFELRRQGRAQKSERISLERIPMELLILLLERQGSVVTRQEIVDRLWGKDVFVDTEHGINTAIRKVRQALKDDPDNPRFVHTVSGKGYRFVTEENGRPPHAKAVAAVPPEAPQPMWGQPPPLSPGAELSRRSPDARDLATVEITPSRTKRAIAAVALCLITAAALIFILRGRIFRTNQAAQIHSIAVLPLSNLSGDSSQDYFADGMTDELITALAKSHSLRVVSRTSAMQYKGVQRPVRDIARELGVDGVLEGSLSRTTNRVHMTVQLIYAPTDSHVWAESYDRDLNQAYSLPEELSQTVAKEVKAATSPAPAPRHINPEAHDDYMQGLYFWNGANPDRSLEYYEKAIRLQPDYAAAWSGVANSYAAQVILDEFPAKNVASKMEEAARKAVAIDDSSPEAHNALAMWYLLFAWDVADADAESRRSLQLNSNLAATHRMRAWVLDAMHEPDESFREVKQAITLDPMQYITDLGEAYMARGQFDDAIAELQRRSETEHDNWFIHFDLIEIYWLKGMKKEAVEELEKIVRDDPAKTSAVRRAYTRGGSPAVAQWMMDDFKADAVRKKYLSPFEMARHYAFLGDKPNTLKFLEASYDQRYPYLIMVQGERMFDLVHSEPRYQALIKRMGLPPAW
jgi:TolB-like protein/DNA-binding winged helix-turn-helix (wHTH) protein